MGKSMPARLQPSSKRAILQKGDWHQPIKNVLALGNAQLQHFSFIT
jgi:hypothetical protein